MKGSSHTSRVPDAERRHFAASIEQPAAADQIDRRGDLYMLGAAGVDPAVASTVADRAAASAQGVAGRNITYSYDYIDARMRSYGMVKTAAAASSPNEPTRSRWRATPSKSPISSRAVADTRLRTYWERPWVFLFINDTEHYH
jgi:hypothetical protein